ncbi:MAG TPA: 30S ribosomal protein S16 [Candidatus Omnitrophica bacterium]|nr:MAG: 30S ribosomal protein S16 [Omnitrophica WOR_2 bacterium GWA2_45_18]HBR15487.1 30S ribosomal protein S16 [Candidatus Omnitrophota bacterium]
MEVRIRLQKSGKVANKRYNYRIVAISRAEGRDGRHLEQLGYYDPAKKPAVISLDQQKLEKWLKKGAQMSDTVKSFVKNLKKS